MGSLLLSACLPATMAFQHQGQLLALWAEQAGSPALLGHLDEGMEEEAEGFADYSCFLPPPPHSYSGHIEGKALAKVPQSWPYGIRAQRKNGHQKDLRLP